MFATTNYVKVIRNRDTDGYATGAYEFSANENYYVITPQMDTVARHTHNCEFK